jgi:iron complex outermembrane receptor protein
VHLNASTTIHWKKQPFTLSIGVRNLLNTSYRDYLNSMRYFTDEMGRNINFRITIPFENI